MKVPSKGHKINIAPGVRFVERNRTVGPVYFLEALTEPICQTVDIDGEECLKYEWTAKDLETGRIVEYGVMEKWLHYSPALFQSYRDSEKYWCGRRSREEVARLMEFCKDIYQLKTLEEYDRLSKEFNV